MLLLVGETSEPRTPGNWWLLQIPKWLFPELAPEVPCRLLIYERQTQALRRKDAMCTGISTMRTSGSRTLRP